MPDATPSLTVVTFLWQGWRPGIYKPVHVEALRLMFERYLTIAHRFVCITDQPSKLPNCDTLPLWREGHVARPPEAMNSYRRLRLFDPAMRDVIGTDWILQVDIDTLVCDYLDPLITWDDLRMVQGTMAPYNGSMWLHRLGSRPDLWHEFNPRRSPWEVQAYHNDCDRRAAESADGSKAQQYRGSDQAWIGYMRPNEPVWTAADGVYRVGKKRRREPVPDDARILFFPGVPKPWTYGKTKFHQSVLRRYRSFLQRAM